MTQNCKIFGLKHYSLPIQLELRKSPEKEAVAQLAHFEYDGDYSLKTKPKNFALFGQNMCKIDSQMTSSENCTQLFEKKFYHELERINPIKF